MSQNAKKEVCKSCKKEVSLSHHALEITSEGKPRIKCYQDPSHKEAHEKTDFAVNSLRLVLEARASKREMLAEIDRLKRQLVLDEQAITTSLRREFDAKVQGAVDEKLKKDLAELEANFQKIVDDGEKTRIQLDASFEAQMLDKKALLAEISTQRDTLIVEKADLAQKSFDLQLQFDELTEANSELKARHKGLKDRSLDIVRMLISVGTRMVVLEQKNKVDPKVDPKRIFAMIMGEEYEEEVIPVSDLSNDPTPVPPPATKADVETSEKETVIAPVGATHKVAPEAPKEAPPPMVIQTLAPPVPSAVTVDLDDSMPESEPFASADDEDDGHDHSVDDDDDVVDEEEESSSDDECRVCDEKAKHVHTFTLKNGSLERLTACDPRMHADVLLVYLNENAKSAPKSANDVITLFTPIQ